jgi:hypothetical protein
LKRRGWQSRARSCRRNGSVAIATGPEFRRHMRVWQPTSLDRNSGGEIPLSARCKFRRHLGLPEPTSLDPNSGGEVSLMGGFATALAMRSIWLFVPSPSEEFCAGTAAYTQFISCSFCSFVFFVMGAAGGMECTSHCYPPPRTPPGSPPPTPRPPPPPPPPPATEEPWHENPFCFYEAGHFSWASLTTPPGSPPPPPPPLPADVVAAEAEAFAAFRRGVAAMTRPHPSRTSRHNKIRDVARPRH